MRIDFHTHTFPARIAAPAIKKMQASSHAAAFLDGTGPALTASLQKAGLDRAVVLPVATNPAKVQSMNDLSLRLTGHDGLLYFGCIHPDQPDWRQELDRIAAAGLRGIKLHPVYQGVDFDDVRYLRILERAGELGLIIVIHAGDDIGFPGVVRCSPAMIARACRQVGRIPLVLAHMGGWKNWDEVMELLSDTGVYLALFSAALPAFFLLLSQLLVLARRYRCRSQVALCGLCFGIAALARLWGAAQAAQIYFASIV